MTAAAIILILLLAGLYLVLHSPPTSDQTGVLQTLCEHCETTQANYLTLTQMADPDLSLGCLWCDRPTTPVSSLP